MPILAALMAAGRVAGGFLFDNRLGQLALVGAGLVALIFGFALEQRHIGADRAVAKIEKGNSDAANRGTGAAARSRDERVRGKRDPYTRDEGAAR